MEHQFSHIPFDSELERICKEAGAILLSFWGKQLAHTAKRDGFVTEADLASEAYLIKELQKLVPADIWAEESGQSGSLNNGYRWVIDPLDGTTNFAATIPYFCISIALTLHDEPIVSAIYNPLQDEFFFAQKGAGSLCNGKKITVSDTQTPDQAIIALSFAYDVSKRDAVLAAAQKLVYSVAALRNMGAAALDMAQLAAGRMDAVFFSDLAWWDVAAGALLVGESGGRVTDFQGAPLGPSYRSCVAGGAAIYGYVHDILGKSQ